MESNDQLEPILATVHALLRAEGADDAAATALGMGEMVSIKACNPGMPG